MNSLRISSDGVLRKDHNPSAGRAFDHLDAILPELDDAVIPKVLPTVTTEAFPVHDSYGVTVVEMFRHGCEQLGTIKPLRECSDCEEASPTSMHP